MGRPRRLYFVHLRTGDVLYAQFNPKEPTEKLEAEWKGTARQGATSERLEYDHTKNMEISLELEFKAAAATKAEGKFNVALARDKLFAFFYPMEGDGEDAESAAPSPILLVYGQLYSLRVRLKSIEIKHQEVTSEIWPSAFTAKLGMEVSLTDLMTYERMTQYGTFRDASPIDSTL